MHNTQNLSIIHVLCSSVWQVCDFANDHWFWLLKNCRIKEPSVLVFFKKAKKKIRIKELQLA
jgi:hypothetical protein